MPTGNFFVLKEVREETVSILPGGLTGSKLLEVRLMMLTTQRVVHVLNLTVKLI